MEFTFKTAAIFIVILAVGIALGNQLTAKVDEITA